MNRLAPIDAWLGGTTISSVRLPIALSTTPPRSRSLVDCNNHFHLIQNQEQQPSATTSKMASTVDLTLLGHPSSFPLPSTHSNAIGNDAVRDSSRRPPTPSPLSQPIVTSTPKSTAADESMQPSSEPGNDLTLSEQAFEAMGLLNRQEMQLGNNIKDARKQVIDAEASLALAKRNLKNAKDIQALNATAMRNKRLVG